MSNLIKKSSSGRTLISCTYHADKSLKSLTDVSGKTVHYGYDRLGRLERICDDNGDEIVRYGHTAGGKLKEIRHGNGMHTAYEYDTDDNIIRLTLKNEKGIVFSDFRYEYDLNGNRILKSGSCLLPVEDKIKEQVVRYQYDCMDRLIEEKYDGKPVKYIYDRCGNRLVKVDSDGKEEYNYNRKNQLISRKKGTESVEYRYDLQGNILEEADGLGKTEYHYNAFNQQTTTFMNNGQIQENQYDAEYLRAGISENGKGTVFLYYNGELLAESELNDTVRNRYILGYGVAGSWQKEGYHSYHLDEQNSTAYITEAGQGIENSYQYDAFGAFRCKEENIHNRILYTGQQHDQVTGQYYLRARYYNPVVGRFLQEDVYRGDGLNLYAYCENNPIVFYDPSGYKSSSFLPDELSSGVYGNLTSTFGGAKTTGLTPHHMPSDLYMSSRYGVDTDSGFAMLLETTYYNRGGRHGKTQSYGRPSSEYKERYLSLSPRDALANDLNDLKSVLKSEGLYDSYAKGKIKEYLHGSDDPINSHKGILNQTFTSDSDLISDPDFKGKIIDNEAIFAKDYEDNIKDEKQNCGDGV